MESGRTDDMCKAVASGDWPAVLRYWEAYAAAILEEIGRGACTRERMREAHDFLEWTKRVALCARAQKQQQLNAIHAAQRYVTPPSLPASSLRTSL
jgi:hypothetical protein